MTKLSKKLKEQEDKKIQENSHISDNELLNHTLETTWEVGNVDIHNPLVLDFFRALKNQKVYGKFCKWYEIKTLKPFERAEALCSKNLVDIGDLVVMPNGSNFVNRIKLLKRMIVLNNYDNHRYKWPIITRPQAFEAYAKDYFSKKGVTHSSSPLHYQFMFGMASLIIGMFIIFGIIFYFWGWTVLAVVFLLVLVYSGIGIYKFRKFNIF